MRVRDIMKKRWVRVLLILVTIPLVMITACTGIVTYVFYCNFPDWSGFSPEISLPHAVALVPTETSHVRPRWTPDGSRVVFSTFYVDAGSGAYVAASDGSVLSSIEGVSPSTGWLSDRRMPRSAYLSSDGSLVAYLVGDSAGDRIETSTLDGSDRREIIVDDVHVRGASLVWSPEDSSLAFLRDIDRSISIIGCPDIRWRDERVYGIYAVGAGDAAGPDIREIVSWKHLRGAGHVEVMDDIDGLSWSPDGRFLAFVGEHYMTDEGGYTEPGSGRSVLYTVRADGSDLRELFTVLGRGTIVESLAWSPDSRRIAFMAYGDDPSADPSAGRFGDDPSTDLYLYTIDHEGFDLREVAAVNPLLDESHPEIRYPGSIDWSPDGSRILFSLLPFESGASFSNPWSVFSVGTLYVVDADGAGIHNIGQGSYASWSPDGSMIANLAPYGSDVVLSTMSPDGTDVRVLVRVRDDGFLAAAGSDQRPSATVASCSAGVVVADPDANPGLVRDCEALVKMVDRIAVVGLNWSADTPISEWTGVLSDVPVGRGDDSDSGTVSSPARVRELSLSRLIRGDLFPDAVMELTGLRVLDLSVNGLYGELPSELGGLSELRVLRLDNNGLRGPIPAELGKLRMLEELGLSENPLGGSIPAELGNLSSLRELHLSGNYLSGSIPAELGNLSSLRELYLGRNNLSGPIPSELGNLSALNVLELRGLRGLTGCIPAALADRLFASDGLLMGRTESSGWLPKCGE